MPEAPRSYAKILAQHRAEHRQMAFVAGPRQVGKTTVCRAFASPSGYLNWDEPEHRAVIVAGPKPVAERCGLTRLSGARPTLVFDELHRFRRWKSFLKGFFDVWGDRAHVLVTGSSRLDVYQRGGDSLMGRYFLYHMHPLSIGELVRPDAPETAIRPPVDIAEPEHRALLEHGGFPEPFIRRNPRFTTRWRVLRTQQLVREDVRDLTRIQDLDRLEVLATLLADRSSLPLVYSSLASEIGVSVDTIRRWVRVFISLHHGFLVRPWFKNVAKSLRKEPRWFLYDWARTTDPGRRAETFIACHLHKTVQNWTDLGFGEFELRYLRDKSGREVDFLVVRDRKPWFLVEAKLADAALSPHLAYFQRATGATHAFQAVLDLPFVGADAFERTDPVIVPARTLLSQLL